jgi:Cu/Ag efflux protein CusF
MQKALPKVALPLAFALVLAGCGPRAQSPEPSHGERIAVRASVTQLPGTDNLLYLHHEAIDRFRDEDGKIVGMDSMTMPFPIAKGLSLQGIEAGDKVTATLQIDWKAVPGVQVVAIEELPVGAPPLVFGEAKPPVPAP